MRCWYSRPAVDHYHGTTAGTGQRVRMREFPVPSTSASRRGGSETVIAFIQRAWRASGVTGNRPQAASRLRSSGSEGCRFGELPCPGHGEGAGTSRMRSSCSIALQSMSSMAAAAPVERQGPRLTAVLPTRSMIRLNSRTALALERRVWFVRSWTGGIRYVRAYRGKHREGARVPRPRSSRHRPWPLPRRGPFGRCR